MKSMYQLRRIKPFQRFVHGTSEIINYRKLLSMILKRYNKNPFYSIDLLGEVPEKEWGKINGCDGNEISRTTIKKNVLKWITNIDS